MFFGSGLGLWLFAKVVRQQNFCLAGRLSPFFMALEKARNFNSILALASGDFCHLLIITIANSMNPDQDRQNVFLNSFLKSLQMTTKAGKITQHAKS